MAGGLQQGDHLVAMVSLDLDAAVFGSAADTAFLLEHPGKVFDLSLPIEKVAEGYKAMDERRAIKTLLTV